MITRTHWTAFGLATLLIPTALEAQGRVAHRFGETRVNGRRVIVHVTVAVPPGQSDEAIAAEALRGQGARPLQPAELTTTGMVWDQFFNAAPDAVVQNYNPAGEPVSAATSLDNSRVTWTAVTTSRFVFQDGGTTQRCPSLVKECPGPQTFDGFNDVGWAAISGCCTLGVTWYSTDVDEADMALNSRFQWTAGGGSGYDVQTVFLHENGHALGLGHSTVTGSIMEATYAGVRRTLQEDDLRGVTLLYPEVGAVGNISGKVTAASGGAPISGATIAVQNLPLSVSSDSSGNYTLTGVPDIGSYSLTARADGFTNQTQSGVMVPATSLNFSLQAGAGGGGCIPRGNGNNCK